MEEIKSIIARNIAQLRAAAGWTQLDLAQKLHYSDKAVSKWERAESVPEIGTLISIAELFEVPLDSLVRAEYKPQINSPEPARRKKQNRAIIAGMSVLLVWLIALSVYVFSQIIPGEARYSWLAFIYAVTLSIIVWLVFNAIWFNRRINYLIISLLMWSCLFSLHITFLPFGYNIWLIYMLGIPGQIIIILWSRLRGRFSPQ